MQLSLLQLFRPLVVELFHHRRMVFGSFAALNILFLGIALVWPKTFSSYVAILVDEKNIIQPLMEGAAVSTEVTDRSRLVRQIVFGRKVTNELLAAGHYLDADATPAEQEREVKRLIRRTKIENIGKNLIKIEYSDSDPDRAQRIAQMMGDLFISESLAAKTQESQSAYDFIDNQTKEYHAKLVEAEKALRDFRSENLDALPEAEADVSMRLNALQTRIEEASVQLKEAEIAQQSLEQQLSGEAESSVVHTREEQYRARIVELQSEIDTLRLRFHDAHPDIVTLKHQIDDLTTAIEQDRRRRESGLDGDSRQDTEHRLLLNPMYQQLKAGLSDTKTKIATLKARIADAKQQMQTEIERGRRVQGGGATLSELTRDYQVNRDIYQDLLKRRETARVSMNLDRDKQGLSFKVHENAFLPIEPSGLRFIHFILIGAVISMLLPVGLVFVRLRYDPRVRLPVLIEERLNCPVISTVPHFWTPGEAAAAASNVYRLMLLAAATFAIVGSVAVLRFLHYV